MITCQGCLNSLLTAQQTKNTSNASTTAHQKETSPISTQFTNTKLKEQQVKIPVEEPGKLEVPEGKNVEDLPESHFQELIKKKGWAEISKSLINLKVWNKNDDKKLSSWADNMQEKLAAWVEKQRDSGNKID